MQSLKHTASCCIEEAGCIFLELCVDRICGFLHLETVLTRYSSRRSWRRFNFVFQAAAAAAAADSELLQAGSRLSRSRHACAFFFILGLLASDDTPDDTLDSSLESESGAFELLSAT